MKFDLDPTFGRVIVIGLLEFFIALMGGLLVIVQEGEMPSPVQCVTIFIVAAIALCVYFVTFLRGETE